jgi:hypothetical protein
MRIDWLPQQTLLANSIANAIGATKRQVQLWTDAGALQCLPETDRQGSGRKRQYEPIELVVGGMIAAMARYQMPVGRLKQVAELVRENIANADKLAGADAKKISDGFNGNGTMFYLLAEKLTGRQEDTEFENYQLISIFDSKKLQQTLMQYHSAVTLNVTRLVLAIKINVPEIN